jgi:hypothetical protein
VHKYGRFEARTENTPETVMQPAVFQLVLPSLLFSLALFLTATGPVEALDLADIESQMVDADGTPLRGSKGSFGAKMPNKLYPQLPDGKSTTPRPRSRKN